MTTKALTPAKQTRLMAQAGRLVAFEQAIIDEWLKTGLPLDLAEVMAVTKLSEVACHKMFRALERVAYCPPSPRLPRVTHREIYALGRIRIVYLPTRDALRQIILRAKET